ncbi:exonuclease domain-containing protein [Actinokineospora diospyrosa]|uniref:DNA polymerase-3 subunit epsilon n=1 Tax=Actinokineospora diospyrosa TaxID=103728 RepID=A0ABT1IFM2_9PSEU|nr:exonuclease domain-containing protein [Actinokineospora diospyrosa]MCP2271410.1 DNA polymerase-3 subunit epsilon [Actinokineospora diospyrosa]
MGYAVVDVETTGLAPGRHHRVVEVAIVQLDDRGRVTDEWCTLVNPRRDLGPGHIHGIRAADARLAPLFDDIAGTLADLLAGRVLVGHNVSFDARFLQAEYTRLGVDPGFPTMPTLCTMRLADQFLTTTARTLSACCTAAGVEMSQAHSALHDARATAALLASYLTHAGTPAPWSDALREAKTRPWPDLPRTTAQPVTRGHAHQDQHSFLSRLVDHLPRVSHPPHADEYLAVLDRALQDRVVSVDEQQELLETAQTLGLEPPDVLALHRTYLTDLANAAWSDRVITQEEAADLELVASLLALTPDDLAKALFHLTPGDAVVFTGQTREPRQTWEARATTAGLQVGASVSKKTRLLIAADPDSMSGKAAKARKLGIPIISEDTFVALFATIKSC